MTNGTRTIIWVQGHSLEASIAGQMGLVHVITRCVVRPELTRGRAAKPTSGHYRSSQSGLLAVLKHIVPVINIVFLRTTNLAAWVQSWWWYGCRDIKCWAARLDVAKGTSKSQTKEKCTQTQTGIQQRSKMAARSNIIFYTAFSPNGHKVAITLEELGLSYEMVAVDLPGFQHKEPWYLAINPNGRIPALSDTLDDGKTINIFESGSIQQYLVERYDTEHKISYPRGTKEFFETNNWVRQGTGRRSYPTQGSRR